MNRKLALVLAIGLTLTAREDETNQSVEQHFCDTAPTVQQQAECYSNQGNISAGCDMKGTIDEIKKRCPQPR